MGSGTAGGVGDPAEAESAASDAMESNRKMFVVALEPPPVVAVDGVIKLLFTNFETFGVLTAELGPNSPAIIGLVGSVLCGSWNGDANIGEMGGGLKKAAAGWPQRNGLSRAALQGVKRLVAAGLGGIPAAAKFSGFGFGLWITCVGRGGLADDRRSELLLLPLVCDAEMADEDFSLAGDEIIDEHSDAFRLRNSSAAAEDVEAPVGVLLEVTPLALAHLGPPEVCGPWSSLDVEGDVDECGIGLDSSNFVLETADDEIAVKFEPLAATAAAAACRCSM